MPELGTQKCTPCHSATTKPLKRAAFTPYLEQTPGWEVVDDLKIEKKFQFKNFKEALAFVNKVGELAEQEQHHPNIYLHGWNKVKITLTTHAIKGLSINDFIMATKVDKL